MTRRRPGPPPGIPHWQAQAPGPSPRPSESESPAAGVGTGPARASWASAAVFKPSLSEVPSAESPARCHGIRVTSRHESPSQVASHRDGLVGFPPLASPSAGLPFSLPLLSLCQALFKFSLSSFSLSLFLSHSLTLGSQARSLSLSRLSLCRLSLWALPSLPGSLSLSSSSVLARSPRLARVE